MVVTTFPFIAAESLHIQVSGLQLWLLLKVQTEVRLEGLLKLRLRFLLFFFDYMRFRIGCHELLTNFVALLHMLRSCLRVLLLPQFKLQSLLGFHVLLRPGCSAQGLLLDSLSLILVNAHFFLGFVHQLNCLAPLEQVQLDLLQEVHGFLTI